MTIKWRNDLALPMARPRYYDSMYLRAGDLGQAVDYLLSRQNLLTRLLQPVGVVSGLDVVASGSNVKVTQGAAVDADGTVLVLPEDKVVTIPADGSYTVTMSFYEWLSEPRKEGGTTGDTRWTEEGRLELLAAAPADPERKIVLGQVSRSAGVVTVDLAQRRRAGLKVAAGAIMPTAGDHRQAGIQFPSDPGGGSGDEAYIRYFPYGGENTILRIGTGNDPADCIALTQGGGDRLLVNGGMLHFGNMWGGNVASGQVVAAFGFHGPGVQHAQLSFRAGRGFELVDRSSDGPSLDYAFGSKPYADLNARDLYASSLRSHGALTIAPAGTTTINGNLQINGHTQYNPGQTLTGQGRLHINANERLHLMPSKGVFVGAGGGREAAGCLGVQDFLFVGGMSQFNGKTGFCGINPVNIPNWSGGGLATFDLFASGAIYLGPTGWTTSTITLDAGSGVIKGKSKQFVIDHPLDDPDSPERRQLVHAALEGPENGVYYRGEATLAGGRAKVELPSYFEALTTPAGRTVQLTPILDDPDDGPVPPLASSRVTDGAFTVRTADGSESGASFFWEVKAIRSDIADLEVEVRAG